MKNRIIALAVGMLLLLFTSVFAQAPDTLFIDDGIDSVHSGGPYIAQKFTPGVPCTLKSVILKLTMSGMQCSLFVWNDSSGYPQSSINLIPPIHFLSSYLDWQKIDLLSPIVISENFWVGIYITTQIFSDNTANCQSRMAWSIDKLDWWVWYYREDGEFLIRAIGSLAGDRHDVSCNRIFSKKGIFLQNPANDTMCIVVKNFGNVTEKAVPVYLRVLDSFGMLVFFDYRYIDSLQQGGVDTVFIPWNYNQDGSYIIEGYPWISNDIVPDNDRQRIRSYIKTYPCELYYDYYEYTFATTTLDIVASKFFPPYYPCRIESVKCCFDCWQPDTQYTYGISLTILDDDEPGGYPGTTLAKDSVMGLGNASFLWLTMDFTPQNAIIDSGGFFAQWTFIPDSTTPPSHGPEILTDAGNPPYSNMTWIKRVSTWYHYWEHWDPFLRVWVNFPSAVSEDEDRLIARNAISINPTISNGKIKCSFCIEKDCGLDISCYGVDGRMRKSILRNVVKEGLHYIYPNLSDLPQGVYFIRIEGEGFSDSKKIIILK
jgi:hypothetical protein